MRPNPIRVGSLLLTALLLSPVSAEAATQKGWSLDEVLPPALSITGTFRARYEYLSDQFRIAQQGDADLVALRTLVHARLSLPFDLVAGAELEDSRAEETGDTPLNTTIVNTAELLQAYLELDRDEIFGGSLRARGGRLTMDVGSRRFVARNRYRNTLNGFTGLDLEWTGSEESGRASLRGFWTLPVYRQPNSQERLRDNDVVFDEESLDVQFWGLFAARDLPVVGRGELFVFGIHEQDGGDRPTRNRSLATPGFRLFRAPAPGRFDYQLETAFQFGESRANVTSTRDLDHFAHFHHAELGYTFDVPCSPRVALQYDYASGDEDPDDDDNERFDTLYGARRFDFGPTGIYGPFARSNINSPGLRFQARPHARLRGFVAYRLFWLASAKDAWTTTGVSDPTGDSGRFLGQQIEFRIRADVLPGNLGLEVGYAHLFAGSFIDDAPNSNDQGDSDYVYTQAVVSF